MKKCKAFTASNLFGKNICTLSDSIEKYINENNIEIIQIAFSSSFNGNNLNFYALLVYDDKQL